MKIKCLPKFHNWKLLIEISPEFKRSIRHSMKNNNQGKSGERINFKPGVADILYRQAGGRCSVPRCKNPTMGPFYEREGAVNMGVACHIFSASNNGPRGRGGKDEEFISSEKNGIWCCAYHASLIDKAGGCDYPATVLFAWKELAEARTRKQMNDSPSPLGWVHSIGFTEFPPLNAPPQLTFSRRTLLWGKNGSGKTSLMEIAASITQSRYADRFTRANKSKHDQATKDTRFSAKAVYSTVDTFCKEISLEVCGQILIRFEGAIRTLLPPGDLEVVYCPETECARRNGEDDVDLLSRVLNIDRSALFSLTSIGVLSLMPGEIVIRQAMDFDEEGEICCPRFKDDEEPYLELLFKEANRDFQVSYCGLSDSEKGRLILDLLILKAREISKQRLTLLLIDGFSSRFDSSNFERLLRALSEEEFQVAVSLAPAQEHVLLSFQNGAPILNKLDYLDSWHLATLPADI